VLSQRMRKVGEQLHPLFSHRRRQLPQDASKHRHALGKNEQLIVGSRSSESSALVRSKTKALLRQAYGGQPPQGPERVRSTFVTRAWSNLQRSGQ
jgi:hypothetical protein